MARIALIVAVCIGVAAASHKRSEAEIAAEASAKRAEIKNVFMQSLMGSGRKREDADQAAEEWLETIQEAKRSVNRKMGIPDVEPINDGLWQGDILLTKDQAERIIAENDGKLSKRGISQTASHKWPTTIPYYIAPTVTATTRAAILAGFNQLSTQLTCIKFQQISAPLAKYTFMNFIMAGSGAGCQGYAYIGYSNGYYDNTVGVNVDASFCSQQRAGCTGGTTGASSFANAIVIHEIFHALGYSHEHCRSDRDSFVSINMANIQKGMENNFAKDTTTGFSNYGQPYNFSSVMHYQNNVMTKNGGTTMTAISNPTVNNKLMGNSCGAIPTDLALGNRLYGCSG